MHQFTYCRIKKQALLLLVIISFCKGVSGQDISSLSETHYLNGLNVSSKIELDSFWQYHTGDDSAWNNPELNTSDWQSVNMLLLQDKSGKPLEWKGIGWFRKTFTLPDSLQGNLLAIHIASFGALEIYLDGRQVVQYGDVSANPGHEKTMVPRNPFVVMPENGPVHVIAIRYSNHQLNNVFGPRFLKGVSISLSSASNINSNELFFQKIHPVISASFIYAFCLFFLFVYWFYPIRIASLSAALLLANFGTIFLAAILSDTTRDGNAYQNLKALWAICAYSNAYFILFFLYSIYYGKITVRSLIILALYLVNVYFIFHPAEVYKWIYNIISILLLFETARILVMGIIKKKTGFWILMIGTVISFLGYLIFINNSFHLFPDNEYVAFRDFGGIFPDLDLPLVLALQLAWEFGSTNRDLEKQLVQVKTLSEENISKEREKQQILSTQNITLEKQVSERTASLNQSLNDLRAAQTKLIQSEKMASLGELTAGIAHEIQNPLNFVNNFSEVNTELIGEMKKEIAAGNYDEVKHIATDLDGNTQKIEYHGKRADAIVKSMLQHSRTSIGQKEPTDINELADEYLRLSYHGIRARDKSRSEGQVGFNAVMQTDFDDSIGKIDIIPQDIGRVLLNLFNNAFYAVGEKKKTAGEGYTPTVSVSTKRKENSVEIKVRDNGTGITEEVKKKLFQPFFTTKPTGEGTGLGLSLSYDIAKAHGGSLEIDDQDTDFTTFVLVIPINQQQI